MRLNEIIQITPSTEIYLDMDGVLADFFTGYQRINPNIQRPADIPSAKNDSTLVKIVGTDFFYRLPKYRSADQLVNTVLKYVDYYNTCSSPLRGDHENAEMNKRKWIALHLSPKPREIIITSQKQKYAVQPDGSPNILIDDKPINIEKWNNAGGIGIQYDANTDSPVLVDGALKRIFTQ